MRCFLFALVLPFLALRPAVAAETDLSANAALKYWQAFAQLSIFDKEQEKQIEDWNKVPIDASASKLLDTMRARMSIEYLHRAVKLSGCDWSLDYDDGPGMLLPHLAKARDLARLAGLHARREFEQGRPAAGVADVNAILTMSRQACSEPIRCTLISILVGYAIDMIAIDAVAPYLPKLDAASLKVLAAHLDSLPQPTTIRRSIMTEKKYMAEWLIRKVNDAEKQQKGSWREFAELLFDKEGREFLKSVDGPEKLVKLTQDLLPFYDQLAKLLELPREEFDAKYPDFVHKAKADNPLAALLLPAIEKVMAAQRRNLAQLELYKAALIVVRDGPEKAKDVRDPFGDGPFEYRKFDGGFELKSKYIFRDKPVSLTVGVEKKQQK